MSRASGFLQLGFICALMCDTIISPALVHAANPAPQVPPLQVPVDQLDGIQRATLILDSYSYTPSHVIVQAG
ncbi:MAG TPA: hypothetical protein PL109_06185, partial [Nitrospira sp.]|nr:hypothetical protein [Nitrospira sp.]